MEMAKSSDDTDHLTIPDHCLSIGDECMCDVTKMAKSSPGPAPMNVGFVSGVQSRPGNNLEGDILTPIPLS